MNLSEVNHPCIICGSVSRKNVFHEDHFLMKCLNCGLVCTKIIPSEEVLKKFYDEYPSYVELSDVTLQRYNEILDMLEKYRKTNNLLESGCGYGFFLEEAKKRNWNVFGTEKSAKALNECRKKNIPVSEHIEQIIPSGEKFDAVVSLEVIEHLTNPSKEIATYTEILRPGGVAYFTTPNFDSLSRLVLKDKWNVIIYPEHLYYFTGKTISTLLSKKGFKKVSIQAPGFSPARLIYAIRAGRNGKDSVSQYDYNSVDRQFRDSIDKTIILKIIKNMINSILSFFKAGDTLKVLFQKK